ncbi:unnamed protein product, partial [Protopolystoma xenopodis]
MRQTSLLIILATGKCNRTTSCALYRLFRRSQRSSVAAEVAPKQTTRAADSDDPIETPISANPDSSASPNPAAEAATSQLTKVTSDSGDGGADEANTGTMLVPAETGLADRPDGLDEPEGADRRDDTEAPTIGNSSDDEAPQSAHSVPTLAGSASLPAEEACAGSSGSLDLVAESEVSLRCSESAMQLEPSSRVETRQDSASRNIAVSASKLLFSTQLSRYESHDQDAPRDGQSSLLPDSVCKTEPEAAATSSPLPRRVEQAVASEEPNEPSLALIPSGPAQSADELTPEAALPVASGPESAEPATARY